MDLLRSGETERTAGPPGLSRRSPGHGKNKENAGNSGIDLGKLLGKVGLAWENCWEQWDCWEKGDYTGKLPEKVGLTWENCWEKWN